MNTKKEYNLVCSLGGNCSGAHNLRFRGLRKCSLPFDWVYCTSDKAIYKLAEGFKTAFKNFMLKENLQELSENPEHKEKIQYKDNYAEIIWANHFSKKISNDNEYKKVKRKFDKRARRLLELMQNSDRILFVYSTSFDIGIDSFLFLNETLKTLYPKKEIDIKVISFGCLEDKHIVCKNVEIFKYKRTTNRYDFAYTNIEWEFLDNLKIKQNFPKTFSSLLSGILQIQKTKKAILINIFKHLNTILYFKFYLIGIRIKVFIGKQKDE